MPYAPIAKPKRGWVVTPNLVDYERERRSDVWKRAHDSLDGLPGDGGLNIAYEAVDRHGGGPLRHHLALRWVGKTGAVRDFDLHALTSRFANVLQQHEVGRGVKGAIIRVAAHAAAR